MKPVGILLGIHPEQRTAEVQLGWQWMLNQKPVNSAITVEPVDGRVELALRRARGKLDIFGPKARAGASFVLLADVARTRGIVANEDRSEPGHNTERAKRLGSSGHSIHDGAGDWFPFEKFRGHGTSKWKPRRAAGKSLLPCGYTHTQAPVTATAR
jgi:hypothetical protein